ISLVILENAIKSNQIPPASLSLLDIDLVKILQQIEKPIDVDPSNFLLTLVKSQVKDCIQSLKDHKIEEQKPLKFSEIEKQLVLQNPPKHPFATHSAVVNAYRDFKSGQRNSLLQIPTISYSYALSDFSTANRETFMREMENKFGKIHC